MKKKKKVRKKIKKSIKRIKENKSLIWNITKKIIGIILIIIGLVGLFLPFLQGILLIIVGLAFLGNKQLKEFFLNLAKKQKKKSNKK